MAAAAGELRLWEKGELKQGGRCGRAALRLLGSFEFRVVGKVILSENTILETVMRAAQDAEKQIRFKTEHLLLPSH
jgi:hypothetical protein